MGPCASCPAIETVARLYLQSLEGALAGDADARMRYERIMLELYDQAARTGTGGAGQPRKPDSLYVEVRKPRST
jgi:hypothetical protein